MLIYKGQWVNLQDFELPHSEERWDEESEELDVINSPSQ